MIKLSKLQKAILISVRTWERNKHRKIKRWELTKLLFKMIGRENFPKYYSQSITSSVKSLTEKGLLSKYGSNIRLSCDNEIVEECIDSIADELRSKTDWDKDKVTSKELKMWWELNPRKNRSKLLKRFNLEKTPKQKKNKKPPVAKYKIFPIGGLTIRNFSGSHGFILPNSITEKYNLKEKDIIKIYSHNRNNRIILPFQPLVRRGGSLTYTIPFWAFKGKYKDYWELDKKEKIHADMEIKYHIYKDEVPEGKVVIVSKSKIHKMDETKFRIAMDLYNDWEKEHEVE